nr:putative udp-rhamnose:rhamnosyltransferase 1 [Quercus suber]
MEIENEWVKLLGELHDIPVIPVGLLPTSAQESSDNEGNSTWYSIVEWLDKQKKGSVVYIALGSEVRPSQEDFTELALGLEHSGLPFFWALRKQSDSASGDSVQLLEGFEERAKVIEALQFGRALIMLPFFADQGPIARFLGEKLVGVEVPRNEEDGSFTKDSIAETLTLVMKEEEGKTYRDKAKEMTTIFGDTDLQYRYVDKFIEFLERHAKM